MKIIFYERFIELCELNGILPTIALRKMGLSTGCLTKWKKGSNITISSLESAANFFNVPLEHFTSDVEIEVAPYKSSETNEKIKFGERIRLVRKNAKCSQKEFGSMLNIPQSTLSAYETNRMQPTIVSLVNIAKKFNVSLDWLCGIDDYVSPFEKQKELLEKVILDETAAIQAHILDETNAIQAHIEQCKNTLCKLDNQLNDLRQGKHKQREN